LRQRPRFRQKYFYGAKIRKCLSAAANGVDKMQVMGDKGAMPGENIIFAIV
jgi:hypothetical protein